MHENFSRTDSIQNVLCRVRSLARRSTRDSQGVFWIEGIRQFVQAFDASVYFQTVIQSRRLLTSDLPDMLARRLKSRGVRQIQLTPEQFRSISITPRASGIGAIVRQHWTPLADAHPDRGICWLVMEEIRSPGNLGTILRTAEACGVGGVIFVGTACDPFDPAVVRASMGGIFHLPLIRTTHEELRQWAMAHGMELVGLSPRAARLWTDLPPARIALVLGEERSGLSDLLGSLCQTSVRLPMTGRADSLNVGIAAGVMMYEMMRRATTPQLTHDAGV